MSTFLLELAAQNINVFTGSYTNTDIFRFMCEDIWQRLESGSGVNTKRFYLDSWVQGSGRIKIYITLTMNQHDSLGCIFTNVDELNPIL